MKGKGRAKKGFTLIEIIISLAILSLIGLMAFSVLSFSNKVFARGEKQSDIQFSVRMASNDITKRLRTAASAQILSSLPDLLDPDISYICINNDTLNNTLNREIDSNALMVLKDKDGIDILHSPGLDINPVITFIKNPGSGRTVNFTIECEYKGQRYSVNSEVALLNMNSWDSVGGDNSGPILAFGPHSAGTAGVITPTVEEQSAMDDRDSIDLAAENPGKFTINSDSGLTLNASSPNEINLPVSGSIHGSGIAWKSSNTDVISISGNNGAVTRPPSGTAGVTVFLTATVTYGSASYNTQFTIYVGEVAGAPLSINNLNSQYEFRKGTDFTISAAASGGSGGYTLSCSYKPEFVNTVGITGSNILISGRLPNANNNTYTIKIILEDSEGHKIERDITVKSTN